MKWKTRITDLFGCKYPIIEGAYGGFGKWQLAAAVSNAGALGLITAGTSRTPERLREDIKRCQDATDKPFMVNLSIGICPQIEKMLEVCLEEGVTRIETAGYKPDALAPTIKASGVKWIHKSARVKDAIHAEQVGADAVIIVGLEGAGFKSPEQMPTMINIIWAKNELKIPMVAAGGISDARGFLGALSMGADGIMMGTAFMVTKEAPIGARAKETMSKTIPGDLQLRRRVLSDANPEKWAEVMKLRGTIPDSEWIRKLEDVRNKPSTTNPRPKGPTAQGSLAMTFIHSVPTVKELIDSMVVGAEELLKSYEFVKSR